MKKLFLIPLVLIVVSCDNTSTGLICKQTLVDTSSNGVGIKVTYEYQKPMQSACK